VSLLGRVAARCAVTLHALRGRSAAARRVAEEGSVRTFGVLEAVIEATTDTIFVKDFDGRFIAVNAKAA
jgi:hypothetical protein